MIKPDSAQLIRATRLMIALLAGSLTSHLLKIPMSGWIMITTCVVLFDQDTVGGTISRGKLRFWATFYGALISLVCIILFPDNKILIWLVIAVTTFIYAYTYMGTAKSYIGVLGSATLAIILLSGNHPNLHTAFYRIMDITIGVAFAIFSMLFFFPEYALNRAYKLTLKSLTDISTLIQQIEKEKDLDKINQHTQKAELSLLKDIINFNKTLDEARHEVKARREPAIIEHYSQCLLQIRRLYRLIIFIFYYELDANKISNPQIHLLCQQIGLILKDSCNIQKISNIHTMEANYLQLNQMIASLEEDGFRHAIQNFSNELQCLSKLIQSINSITNKIPA